MLAIDFFHVDCVVTLRRLNCLFVMEVGSCYGTSSDHREPGRAGAAQQICSLLMDLGDRAAGFRFPGP